MVEPPATVGLSLFSAPIHDVSYDSPFSGVERVELWCTVCGSHVQRISTRSDCSDLDAGFFLVFFWEGHGEMLRVREVLQTSPQHLARAPLFLTTDFFLASTCPLEKILSRLYFLNRVVQSGTVLIGHDWLPGEPVGWVLNTSGT